MKQITDIIFLLCRIRVTSISHRTFKTTFIRSSKPPPITLLLQWSAACVYNSSYVHRKTLYGKAFYTYLPFHFICLYTFLFILFAPSLGLKLSRASDNVILQSCNSSSNVLSLATFLYSNYASKDIFVIMYNVTRILFPVEINSNISRKAFGFSFRLMGLGIQWL